MICLHTSKIKKKNNPQTSQIVMSAKRRNYMGRATENISKALCFFKSNIGGKFKESIPPCLKTGSRKAFTEAAAGVWLSTADQLWICLISAKNKKKNRDQISCSSHCEGLEECKDTQTGSCSFWHCGGNIEILNWCRVCSVALVRRGHGPEISVDVNEEFILELKYLVLFDIQQKKANENMLTQLSHCVISHWKLWWVITQSCYG